MAQIQQAAWKMQLSGASKTSSTLSITLRTREYKAERTMKHSVWPY